MSNNDDLHPIRDDILIRKQVIADLNVNYGNHICSKYDSDCCRNKIYILTKKLSSRSAASMLFSRHTSFQE